MPTAALDYLFCTAVITAAFAVRGTAGFGSAAVAVPLVALVLPVQTVVPVVATLQLASSIEHGVRSWRLVDWNDLLRMAPFTIAGVGLGVFLFHSVDSRLLTRALGLAVIAYALYTMATAALPPTATGRVPWPIGAVLNTIGAALGAAFGGVAAPFYAFYFRSRRLERDAFRASMTAILLVQVVLRMAGYTSLGLMNTHVLLLSALAVPLALLGGRIGEAIAGRVNQLAFNKLIGAVLLVSGAVLLLK